MSRRLKHRGRPAVSVIAGCLLVLGVAGVASAAEPARHSSHPAVGLDATTTLTSGSLSSTIASTTTAATTSPTTTTVGTTSTATTTAATTSPATTGTPSTATTNQYAFTGTTPPSASALETSQCACFGPKTVEAGYKLSALFKDKKHPIDGKGETIAIVAPGNPPKLKKDLEVFDKGYKLQKPPSITVKNFDAAKYTANTPAQTAYAVTLVGMVDYVHAMAPGASLLVVETETKNATTLAGLEDTFAADKWVLDGKGNRPRAQVLLQGTAGVPDPTIGPVIGLTIRTDPTWAPYLSPKTTLGRLHKVYEEAKARHVTVVARTATVDAPPNATGVLAQIGMYPGTDPLVASIGTVTLPAATPTVSTDVAAAITYAKIPAHQVTTRGANTALFGAPSYQQSSLVMIAARVGRTCRATPDLSMGSTRVLIYLSTLGSGKGWEGWRYGEAPALFAGLVAVADQEAGHPLGFVTPAIWAMAATFSYEGLAHVTIALDGGPVTTTSTGDLLSENTPPPGTGWSTSDGWGTVVNAPKFMKDLIHVAHLIAKHGTYPLDH